jgi:N-acetylneuraminic acid mutarotase
VTQIPSQGYPSTSTIGSVLLLLEDCLYTFGGSSMPEVSKDFKRFNLTTLTWSEILPSSEDSPSMRSNSLGFSYNRKLFILGGKSESLILFDLWSFDLESNSWSLVKTEGLVPVARLKSLTCVENDFLYLFGGETVQGNDLKLYK